jgi:multiple sugar transport system substrate-binding protein
VPVKEYRINKELINEFKKNNPGVDVLYINIPGNRAMAKLQAMFAAGTPPDVMSIHGAYFLQFASKGLLMLLDEFINNSKDLKLSDFYPRIIDGCRYNGKLFSLPRYTSVYILFYNKDLFDKEKIPYPDDNWTWESFTNTAIKLTKDINNDGKIDQYGFAMNFGGAKIYPWIWQNDGRIFDTEKNICLLDDENTGSAIQFLVDLKYKYNVTPMSLPAEYKSNVEMFRVGRVGMFMSGVWEIQNLKSEKKFSWDIAHLPGKKRRATMLGMENYAISSKTENKELSYRFLEFLLNEKSQFIMAERLDKQPSLITAGKRYAERRKEYNRKVLTDAIEYGIVPPNLSKYNEVYAVLQRQLDLIWIGEKTVKEGLREATLKINSILKEAP